MKKLILTFTLLTAVHFGSTLLHSQDLLNRNLSLGSSAGDKEHLIIEDKISKTLSLTDVVPQNKMLADLKSMEFENKSLKTDMTAAKKKSVALGVLLSAVLPGAGEFYGGNYLKAGIFFGIELLAWGTYIYFTKKGDNQTEDYQKYADQYWSVRKYAAWLVNEGFPDSGQINPNEPDINVLRQQIMECEQHNFSHTMPEYGSQQYYELIGKYQNFQAGWTNLEHEPTRSQGPYWYETYHDPVYVNYAITRQDANDQYEYAKIGPVTAIINRVLSAADAAWVITTYNNKIKVETGFRMENRRSPYTYGILQVPTFNMKVSF